jgi:hypothetical protein
LDTDPCRLFNCFFELLFVENPDKITLASDPDFERFLASEIVVFDDVFDQKLQNSRRNEFLESRFFYIERK